jgi:hypothetical protein
VAADFDSEKEYPMSPYVIVGGIGIALPGFAIIFLLLTGAIPSRRVP